ncbi:MAG: hemerythrin family protein [Treponema sp.]|nr:hemerythrin family protein [Treponema sp.]
MKKRIGIAWDDRYLVDVQIIDDQHRELIKQFNEFYSGCKKSAEPAAFFSNNIHGLMNYIRFHFSTEEEFLEKIHYPDIAAHKMQHRIFIADILKRIDTLGPGRPGIDTTIDYFRDWIITHFSLIDRKYATYIHIIRSQDRIQDVLIRQSIASVCGTCVHQTLPTEVFIG